MNADWECPCDQCMGRLEPPDYEPTDAEIDEMERVEREREATR